MEPHSRFINVNGIALHVAEWGGSGPDLFLVHANGFLGRVYRLMLAQLVAHFRILTLDLRGQGDSEKLAALEHYQWQYLAADVTGVVDQLGLHDFYAVGHSGGASLLALYAATHPGRVTGLALLEPVCFPHEPEFLTHPSMENHPFVERARRRREVWDSRWQLFTAYQDRETFAGWQEEVLWDYVNHGTYTLPDGRIALKCAAEVEAQVFANAQSLDIFAQLDQIDCPALVLRGAQTDPPLFVVAERVAQRIPRGSLLTVPDTSHFLPMEKPEEVGGIISRYFRAA